MATHSLLGVVTLAVVLTSAARGDDLVNVTLDIEDALIERAFEAGDIMPLTFSVSTTSDAPLFGADFEVVAATADVRIAWADAAPDYFVDIELARQVLPGSRFRTVRVQPLGAIDRSLGADGGAVPFVTIGVEIVNGAPFESALEISALGALLGKIPQGTTILGRASADLSRGRGSRAQGRIEIVNLGIQEEPWTTEFDDLALELRPVGGRASVRTLTATTTYELHYRARIDQVSGYVLYAIAASAEQSLAHPTPPPTGPWADTGLFIAMEQDGEPDRTYAAAGYEDGYYKYDVVGDDIWPCEGGHCGPAVGHLCNFTTEEPGQLNLRLIMYYDDLDARMTVEMQADAEYPVLDPASREE